MTDSVSDPRIIDAMRRMAALVRSRQQSAHVGLFDHVGGFIREKGAQAAIERREKVRTLLLPSALEPLSLGWSPLRLLGRQHDEPSWTQWLAHVLGLRNLAGELTWEALCLTAAQAARAQPPQESTQTACAEHWTRAAKSKPEIEPERYIGNGFLDIWATAPEFCIVVENKLWATWHDHPTGQSQASRYGDYAARVAAQSGQWVGLLLLSVRPPEPEELRDGWVFTTWMAFGQELRRQLRKHITPTDSPTRLFELLPVALTLESIERDLLGFRYSNEALSYRDLDDLDRLARYLEGPS